MRFQFVTVFMTLVLTVLAVPELEHDREEYDVRDCKIYTPFSCIRDCPRGYVGVYRDLCYAAEDQHECCAVRCCRSRHTNDQEGDENEGELFKEYYQAGIQGSGRRVTAGHQPSTHQG